MSAIVAVDLGGTHARFALAEVADGRVVSLGPETTLRTSAHASFQRAWDAFARAAGEIVSRVTRPRTRLDARIWSR